MIDEMHPMMETSGAIATAMVKRKRDFFLALFTLSGILQHLILFTTPSLPPLIFSSECTMHNELTSVNLVWFSFFFMCGF